MTSSATEPSLRDAKRRDTEERILASALRLTEEHGLDGFTMDDLAAGAGVSRRTLFNYVPSKLDAVLGPAPTLSEQSRARFVAGGPHGVLIEDLQVLAREILDSRQVDRERFERLRQIADEHPRILLAVHGRFETISADFATLLGEREAQRGTPVDPLRARLIVRLLVTVFDSAMAAYTAGDDRPLVELFDEHLTAARQLLA
ncbi:TetR/AcrR family transcriptional regulator [Nocardioides sp. SYSU DS0663]|uniref:TetR/AcrR family transcriptional regulator n=1 Tax=Nocardioides sp. SYSU DS0663 TaxID=3416445 RepID=UPI003F4C5D3C